MRQTREVMGTVASIDIPDCNDKKLFSEAFGRLEKIDADYSPYKPSSLVSRFNEDKLKKPKAEFQKIVNACQDWQKATNGYFSAWYDKVFEPSGYVKGWAIAEAARVIKKAGQKSFCIGLGGDVLASSDGEKVWRIGIQDPKNMANVIKVVEVKNGAVATSGTYERGEHIIDPRTTRPARKWSSVSVIGPDIVSADVLATAAFSMAEAQDFLENWHEYNYLLVGRRGRQISNLI